MRRLRSNRRPAVRLDRPAGISGEEKQGQDWTVVEGDEHVSAAAQGSTTTFKGLYNANGSANPGGDESSQPEEYLRRHGSDIGAGGGGGGGSQSVPPAPLRLGKFLRQASVVMETLCEENLLNASVRAGASPVSSASGGDRGGDDRDGRLLFSGFPENGEEGWEEVAYGHDRAAPELAAVSNSSQLGQEEKSRETAAAAADAASKCISGGLSELLKGSEVVGVEFSRVKRSMLVTAHARPAGLRRRRLGQSSGVGADEGVDSDPNSGGGGGGGSEAIGERGVALEGSGVICVWNTDNVKVRVGVEWGAGPRQYTSMWWGTHCPLNSSIRFTSSRRGEWATRVSGTVVLPDNSLSRV